MKTKAINDGILCIFYLQKLQYLRYLNKYINQYYFELYLNGKI